MSQPTTPEKRTEFQRQIAEDGWPCACVKHRKRVLVAIKMHSRLTKQCPKCKATRPPREWFDAQR